MNTTSKKSFLLNLPTLSNLSNSSLFTSSPFFASIQKLLQKLLPKKSSHKKDLAHFLESLGHSLRSGASLKGAVEETVLGINSKISSTLIGSSLKSDFIQIHHHLSLGASLDEVLRSWALANPCPEVSKTTAVLLFGLSADLGGNRARCIEALATSLRGELAIEEEIYALSAQARLSGFVIAVLPLGFLLFFGVLDGQYLSFFFTTGIGAICLLLGVALDALGGWWMRKIILSKNPKQKIYNRRKSILQTVSIALAFAILFSFIWGLLFGALSWFWFGVLGKKRAPAIAQKQYELALNKELADLVDFFIIALGAGLTIRLAIEAILESIQDEILPKSKEVLVEVLDDTQLGTQLADALNKVPDVLFPLMAPLIESERYGVQLLPILESISTQTKESARRRAETRARKIPVKLLFPLVVCILPAFGLLTLMPILVRSIQLII